MARETVGVVVGTFVLPMYSPISGVSSTGDAWKIGNFNAGAQRFYKRWAGKTVVEP